MVNILLEKGCDPTLKDKVSLCSSESLLLYVVAEYAHTPFHLLSMMCYRVRGLLFTMPVAEVILMRSIFF